MRMVVVRRIGKVSKEKNCKSKRVVIPPDKVKLCRQFLKISVAVENKAVKKSKKPPAIMGLFLGGIK